MRAALIYPHQLYPDHPAARDADICVLIEEPLLFTQYLFHAKKLMLMRAAMQSYASQLKQLGLKVSYVDSHQLNSTEELTGILIELGVTQVQVVDPCDDWLGKRLESALEVAGIELTLFDDPHFLTPLPIFSDYVLQSENLLFKDFYVLQRKRLKVLLTEQDKPVGGKWSYDAANRKKLPRDLTIPVVEWPQPNSVVCAAEEYVKKYFPESIGDTKDFCYPTTSEQAEACLQDFFENRFSHFGDYEDAICEQETYLFHSVLTPAMNCGLISPRRVVDKALEYTDDVPLNSLEGFLRQVIGWREYMRGVYIHFGREQRTRNFWDHHYSMPASFYDASTGIVPVDTVIRRVEKYAYCHHIERLMVLGNFMLLCEIDPNAIYKWFMEFFIDAYDWVMVPNVYGMSQHADGGLITTKPYISGSNYILKMSNFSKGPWCEIWDGLYWRFIDKNRDYIKTNPRMALMVSQADRMGDRLKIHLRVAEDYLEQLHGN
ncbi:cryptochrome/photolyase family protein [Bythopirellula goksoeyrii]|uniref:Deoxyribodipyrimidine photo-lyase-related protein n=1 Tax=Bythopirellula goksoeyrii TaxID=1400387 RepID=A0A5B9QEL0_9BACT|nr:cryptochrome/photolyase family protein [Bythopirellula goksoeyrii]QEG37448.1 Deoxyribodipyrimidine photo-lyase-related protein [Bythopirellula goksoeyrii]